MVSVEGTMNTLPFRATLEPDGAGGHWLKVDERLRRSAGLDAPDSKLIGQVVAVEVVPLSPDREPEPDVPPDLRDALDAAPAKAREAWADITPIARRDFIAWVESAKQIATRTRRIASACDMLAKGKRRPCCFDRSGMYSGRIKGPSADALALQEPCDSTPRAVRRRRTRGREL
jgi:hypothetical protein